MDAEVAQALSTIEVALVALRLCAVALVGGFLGAMIMWRSEIWSDETTGEDGEDV